MDSADAENVDSIEVDEKKGLSHRNHSILDPKLNEPINEIGEVPYVDTSPHSKDPIWTQIKKESKRYFKSWMLPKWIWQYQRDWLKGDLVSGLTVGVMSVPQGMAYSLIAGLPPIYGLYASTIPLLVYAFIGTSRELAIGPFALVSILVAESLSMVATPGDPAYIQWAIVLSFFVGAILIIMGLLRLGFIINFMSYPVLEGFENAAALVIGFSQMKYLFGNSPPRTTDFYMTVYEFFKHIKEAHYPTIIMGFVTIAILMVVRKWNQKLAKKNIFIPAPLIVLILGIIIAWSFKLEDHGMQVVGDIPSGFPPLSYPYPNDWAKVKILLWQAFVLALVTFMLSISVAKKYADQRKYLMNSDQELMALGMANLAGCFFSSFPISGSLSRTVVNASSGGRTQLATIVSVLVVFGSLFFLTPILRHLPMNILAAIIMVAILGLFNIGVAKEIYKTKRVDLVLFAIAFISTLGLGIANGIMIGVLSSILVVVYQSSRPHTAVLGRLPGSYTYRNVRRFPHAFVIPKMIVLRLDASLFFANVNFFKDKLFSLINKKDIKCVVIDWSSVNDIDYTACHVLGMVIKELTTTFDIILLFASVKGPVRDVLKRSGLVKQIQKKHFFWELHEAVSYGGELLKGNFKESDEEDHETALEMNESVKDLSEALEYKTTTSGSLMSFLKEKKNAYSLLSTNSSSQV